MSSFKGPERRKFTCLVYREEAKTTSKRREDVCCFHSHSAGLQNLPLLWSLVLQCMRAFNTSGNLPKQNPRCNFGVRAERGRILLEQKTPQPIFSSPSSSAPGLPAGPSGHRARRGVQSSTAPSWLLPIYSHASPEEKGATRCISCLMSFLCLTLAKCSEKSSWKKLEF